MPLSRGLSAVSRAVALVALGGLLLLVVATASRSPLAAGAVAAAIAAAGIAVAAFANWRRAGWWMLVSLPYLGILGIALQPQSGVAVIARDFVLVIPALAGLMLAATRQPALRRLPPTPAVLAFGALALLAVIQLVNPQGPPVLARIIGLKVWLLSPPLLWLGYHLIRSIDESEKLLRTLVLVAMPCCLIGIAEAIAVYGGASHQVYALYGSAADAATQGFAVLDVGGTSVMRIPSTFTFVAQYGVFCILMCPLAYAATLLREWGPLRYLPLIIVIAAALTSGARGALISVPFVLLLTLLLDRRVGGWGLGLLLVSAVMMALVIVGISPLKIGEALGQHTGSQLRITLFDGFDLAARHTWMGLGTGSDTNAARYANWPGGLFASIGGSWQESWWIKSWLELGIAGLVATVAVCGLLAISLVRAVGRVQRPAARAFVAGMAAVTIWVTVYNVKGSYLDLEPLNVALWLLSGVALRIATLSDAERREAAATAPSAAALTARRPRAPAGAPAAARASSPGR